MKTLQATLVVVLFAMSCTPPVSADGGVGGGSGGGTATGGGSATGGGAAGGTVIKSGSVQVSQLLVEFLGNSQWTSNATASFTTLTLAAPPAECATRTVGTCTSRRCPDGGVGMSDAGFTITSESAGVVTITGTQGGDLTLSPQDGGSYPTANFQKQLWEDGAQLTISASGGIVPAFSGKTLTAPGPIVVSAPVCQTLICTPPIVRTAPFTMSWSSPDGGTPVGTVTVVLGADPLAASGGITCTFDAAARTATIPASLLSDLNAGQGLINISNTAKLDFSAGPYLTTVQANSSGLLGFVQIQ